MSVRRSLGISTLTEVAVFLLSLMSVVVVSRLLAPDEIGVFSVAVSIVGFAHILRDFGAGQYLIQLREITREHLRAVFTVMLMISWSIALLLFAVRSPIAVFYSHHGLSDVLALLAINFLLLPFGSHILAILKREMQFGKVAIVGLTSTSIQVTVTILTAWAGESYLSMAWGSIAGNISNVILLSLMRSEYALLLPVRRGLRQVLHFGSRSSVTSVVGELGASGPDLIFGRTLGFEAVAFFSRAASLNNMVIAKSVGVIRQVYFPAFAKGIREGHDAATLYYQSMELIVGVIAPLIVVLALLADVLILFLFGNQWGQSANLAIVLCAFDIIRTPIMLAAPSLIACGHIGTVMRCQLITQFIFLMLLSLSIWLPLEYVVYSLVVARVIETVVYTRALHSHFGVKLSLFWLYVRRSYLLVPFAAAGPVSLRVLAHYGQIELSTLFFLISSGILATAGLLFGIFIVRHPLGDEILRLIPVLSEKGNQP
jgi:O-antigen/teichoic acid export membrane protein